MLASTTSTVSETILLALAVVILVGPYVVRQVHLPATIGLVLGGAIIGPDGIGWMDDGQLDGIGDIGLLYLMFLAGLELDMNLFKRYRSTAIQFGALTFAIPFLLGLGAGIALDYTRPAAILLGSIWASHTLVSLPEVKRFGLAGNRAVAVTVSATPLTDTLALIVLAAVTSGATDDPDSHSMIKLVVGLVALAVYCFLILPRLGEWIFRTLALERANRVVFMLGAFASAALLANAFGIEGLVGAFLAGMGVNRLAPEGGPLAERVEFFGSALFIPAFLIYVGTKLDLAALASWDTLGLALVFVGVVVVGKVGAATILGWREGFSRYEIGVMSGLSIGQAAATLAATLVGEAVGLFDEQVVNGVLVAVLVTILISSVTSSFFARRIPADRTIARPLMSKILIAVPAGGSDTAVLRFAGHVARKRGGEVLPVRIVDTGSDDEERARAEAEVERAAEEVASAGADALGVLRVDSSESDGIVNVIHEQQASLLVLPRADRATFTARFFGDPLEQIGRRSPIPVVVGKLPHHRFDRVVLVLQSGPGDSGTGADAEVGALVLAAIVATFDDVAPVVVVEGGDRRDADLDELSLPARTTVERHDLIDGSWFAQVPPTDLLIVTPGLRNETALRVAELTGEDVGVLVVAGPHRLGAHSPAPPSTHGMLGFIGR
jgi:Kef-type K+ transport system membrane component KefB